MYGGGCQKRELWLKSRLCGGPWRAYQGRRAKTDVYRESVQTLYTVAGLVEFLQEP